MGLDVISSECRFCLKSFFRNFSYNKKWIKVNMTSLLDNEKLRLTRLNLKISPEEYQFFSWWKLTTNWRTEYKSISRHSRRTIAHRNVVKYITDSIFSTSSVTGILAFVLNTGKLFEAVWAYHALWAASNVWISLIIFHTITHTISALSIWSTGWGITSINWYSGFIQFLSTNCERISTISIRARTNCYVVHHRT